MNDILVKQAEPLFFLDYVAQPTLNKDEIGYLIKGIADACKECNCVLLGGETAEMPDVYKEGACDIVGMIVGKMTRLNMIGRPSVCKGDIILGLPSNGPHTNGYTLIRKLVANMSNESIKKLGLCKPHKSYYKVFKELEGCIGVNAYCHISGICMHIPV